MKILIYSDVHGNLPAFQKMLDVEGLCDGYICLGDLVNYGPWGNECVDLAISLPNSTLIMGNHEEAFINGFYSGNNDLVQRFFEKTYPTFTKKETISRFVNEIKLNDFVCIHTIDGASIYPDTKMSLNANYIIGHSHHQFKYNNNDFTLFNAGSVGQNRKYINEINYLIYDLETKEISMRSLIYDLELIINQMKIEDYPKVCIDYYSNKKKKVISSRID
jgi:predicted phosphodiesterase